MKENEYLVMDDAGNIPEDEITPEMNAAVEKYLEELHSKEMK